MSAAAALCREGSDFPERQTLLNLRRALEDGIALHGCEWEEGSGRRAGHAVKLAPAEAVLSAAEAAGERAFV